MAMKAPKSWHELGEQFHMMVGFCITEWATVDDELFQIFQECVGRYEQSAIVYYRTPGLNVRFDLTDELVKSVLPRPTKKDGGHQHPSVKAWQVATTDFKKLLATRRRIAHQPVAVREEPLRAGMPIGQTPSWFEIYMNQHEQLRGSKEAPALRLEDLQTHIEAVEQLRGRLYRFYHDVLTKRATAPTP